MTVTTSTVPPASASTLTDVERSRLVADVARAGASVAPYWPLTAFVAVNPLGGLTDLPFTEATAPAGRWFSARTHLSLAEFRTEHARGRIGDDELDEEIRRRFPWLVDLDPVDLGTVRVDAIDVVRWDLVHGPTGDEVTATPRTLADALDDVLTNWCATFVDDAHVPWAMPDRSLGFYRAWLAVAGSDRRLGKLIGAEGRRRLDELPDDPAAMLAHAFDARGIDESDRVDAIRTLLLRTPGWASFAKWCDDWAPADRTGVRLRMIDLAAARAAIDLVAPEHLDLGDPQPVIDSTLSTLRVDAAAAAFAQTTPTDDVRSAIAAVLLRIAQDDRIAVWLGAHEWTFRNRLLARLDAGVGAGTSNRADAATAPRADAQLVFCIDVRSEGFRRHLESLGRYETFGFAGFFGVPVRWRPLGADVGQARCPVLVSPRHEIVEVAVDDDHAYLATCSTSAGLHDAFYAAKGGIASPFALAESAGWFAGPVAAVRTLLPGRVTTSPAEAKQPWWKRRFGSPRTLPVVDAEVGEPLHSGLTLEERTLFAEAIVTTIGMAEFAPIVVLCGHGSDTVNNPHASSLDCGACGGRSRRRERPHRRRHLERCRRPSRPGRAGDRDPRRHRVRGRRARHDGRRRHHLRSRHDPRGITRRGRRAPARPRRCR